MQYKIYTLQHQRLYDQIHSIQCSARFQKVINKEATYLLDRCKELRKDFSTLSKVRECDALFSDVFLMHKRKTYSFEHIVVNANKVYVLEKKKHYDNQKQLLKEKVAYLKKLLGKYIVVDFFIIMDGKVSSPNCTTMDKFIELCKSETANDGISHNVNQIIQSKHVSIDVVEYIRKKHNIDITVAETKRKAKWVDIIKFSNPLVSKYKGALSFLSSGVIFIYILTSCFNYSIYAKDKQFLLTIGIDVLFLFILINILREIEGKLPKWLRITTLSATLCVAIVMFGRTLYYI